MSLINTIICGDCREILPTLPAKSFQLAFADPPYWVGFDYGEKTDKEIEYIEPHWLVNELLRIADTVLITPGMYHEKHYPQDWIWKVGWFKPGSQRRSGLKGFNTFENILVYGSIKKPVWQDAINLPDVANHTKDGAFHKCPKPEKLLRWLIENFTDPADKVIDPVSGSGTTCKAAFQLGREYLGIEIDPKIAKLSLARVRNSQPPLLAVGGLTQRAADGYAASQQAQLFTDGNLPSKARGATRRR